MNRIFCLAGALLLSNMGGCQEAPGEAAWKPGHRITLALAHAHIPGIIPAEDGASRSVLPAWNFEYDYWFDRRWGLGLHNTLVIQQYKIGHGKSEELERRSPLSVAVVGLWKASERWTLMGGVGRELEKEKSINLLDLGTEYGIELPREWELGFSFKYEYKFGYYNSWLLGIGISKPLPAKKQHEE